MIALAQYALVYTRSWAANIATAPKYLVSDSCSQFTAAGFRAWCHRRGALGQHGSIAVLERFIRTLKQEDVRMMSLVPLLRSSMQREQALFQRWYNGDRPHTTLCATPDEVYFGHRPANRAPRFEPCAAWPRGSPCSRPQTLVKGQPGVALKLEVEFVARRYHLPRATLSRVA